MSGKRGEGRRLNGEGTLEKRRFKSGWKCRLVVKVNGQKMPGPMVPMPSSRRDARLAAAHAWKQKYDGEEDAGGETLEEWLHRLLESGWNGMEDSTMTTHRVHYNQRIKGSALGRTPLAQLRKRDSAGVLYADLMVKAWLDALGKSASTRRNALQTVRKALTSAGINCTVKAPHVAVGDQPVATMKDYRAFLDKAYKEGRDWRDPIIIMLAYMGLRRSEISGLAHEDREGDGVWIRRAVGSTGKGYYAKSTKSGRQRWVPLCPELLDVIGSDEGYVVGWEADDFLDPDDITDRVQALSKGTKFEGVEKFGPHAFRRGFATDLVTGGADVKTVSTITGHSIEMLLKVYTKPTDEHRLEAVRRLQSTHKSTQETEESEVK